MCESAEAEAEAEAGDGIQNQKQTPDTKMWGKTQILTYLPVASTSIYHSFNSIYT